eukprot:288117-Alexandrium_andersonii.AAC.1
MSASLVGSEMCIRDRASARDRPTSRLALGCLPPWQARAETTSASTRSSVSYTHLTLPTICSV